jgi:hypothetical protein
MKQNMHCHACSRDFSVDMNMQADGNHVFKCPYCDHEHCRVVMNGEITDDHWDRRNGKLGAVYYPTTSSSTTSQAQQTYGSTSPSWYITNSWASTSTSTCCW